MLLACAVSAATRSQALSLLVERSGCDTRTAINTLQLLARQHAPAAAAGGSQRGRRRLAITASAVSSSAAFGLKDVSQGPLGVLAQLLSGAGRPLAGRLLQQQAAARAGASGASIAAVASHLQLEDQYRTLLDLGEHELVRAACGREGWGGVTSCCCSALCSCCRHPSPTIASSAMHEHCCSPGGCL